MLKTKNTEATRLKIVAAVEASKAADAAAEREHFELLANLRMYSPRRQWTTRYGAVIVEGVGCVVLGH